MKKAYILLFFSCLGYAFGPPAYMKVVSTGLPPDIIVGYFLLIGGASIMLARHVGQKPRSVRYNTSMILATIAVGIMWPLYFLGYIYAMMQSSIAEATLLTRFTPLMVVILSIWLLSDKVTSWTGILSAVTLCVIGVTVVQSHDFSSGVELTFFTPVVMIMLATCFIGALSEVLRASMSKEIHSSDIVSKSMVVGGAAVFCYKLLWGEEILAPDLEQSLYLLLLGTITVGLPAMLKIQAFKLMKSQGKVAFASYLIPILTVIIAYFWNGERFDVFYFIVSFIFIICGLILAEKSVMSKD